MASPAIDIAVVGAGVVGTATALACARAGFTTTLLAARPPDSWREDCPDQRVMALAPDNQQLLQDLAVWSAIAQRRVQTYRRMCVWDAASEHALCFTAHQQGYQQLGWLVEHSLLATSLWSAFGQTSGQICCPTHVSDLTQNDRGVHLRLDDGQRLSARMLVVADGAASPIRQQLAIPIQTRNYHQQAIIAFVAGTKPHQATAWQRFLPTGPLAVLPWTSATLSAIVWTLPTAQAEHLCAADETTFNRALTQAFAARLGTMTVAGRRQAFPLHRLLALQNACGRVVFLGDAAHVVHPLAGQGLNLGLRDVASLLPVIQRARQRQRDWSHPVTLDRWAQRRHSDHRLAAYAFETMNSCFSNSAMLPTLVRGPLLGAVNRLQPLVGLLGRYAMGWQTQRPFVQS